VNRTAFYSAVFIGALASSALAAPWAVAAPADGQHKVGGKSASTHAADSHAAAATQPDSRLRHHSHYRPAQIGRVIFVLNEPSLLNHILPAMVLDHQTLSAILDNFSTLTNTNVAAGWGAMIHAGIKPAIRRTLRLPKQGYKRDLAAVLKAFAPHVRMVISADQNVIFVNTQAADNRHLIMRSYYLQDLIANIPRYINPNSMGGKKPGPSSVADPAGDKSKRDNSHDKSPSTPHRMKNPEVNILQLITDHVEPKVWINHGGKATISQVGNKVVVIAPASVQALLQGPSHYNPNAAPMFAVIPY
jgi:hypothetical protein